MKARPGNPAPSGSRTHPAAHPGREQSFQLRTVRPFLPHRLLQPGWSFNSVYKKTHKKPQKTQKTLGILLKSSGKAGFVAGRAGSPEPRSLLPGRAPALPRGLRIPGSRPRGFHTLQTTARSVPCSLGLADRSCSGIPWPELEDARGARGSEPRLALRWKSLKHCRNISVEVLPRAVQRSNNNGAIKERRKEAKCIVLKIRLQIGEKKKNPRQSTM